MAASLVSAALRALGLEEHLDPDTYGDVFASLCAEPDPEAAVASMLSLLVAWDPERVRETAQALVKASRDPSAVDALRARVEDERRAVEEAEVKEKEAAERRRRADVEAATAAAAAAAEAAREKDEAETLRLLAAAAAPFRPPSPLAATAAALVVRPRRAPRAEPPSVLDPEARICRHFLAGSCLRSDCAFSHDLSRTPCRFWAAASSSSSGGASSSSWSSSSSSSSSGPDGGDVGFCSAGDSCPFLHAIAGAGGCVVDVRDVEEEGEVEGEGEGVVAGGSAGTLAGADWDALFRHAQLQALDADQDDEDENGGAAGVDLDDVAAFPPLAGGAAASSAPSRLATSVAAPHIRTSTLGARLILQALGDAFPLMAPSDLESCFVEAGGGLEAAAALVTARTGMRPVEGALRPRRIAAATPSASSSSSSSTTTNGGAGSVGDAVARAVAASVSRVATGALISSLYTAHREEAASLARSRNAAFDRATQAFLAGKGDEAARFSKQGRALDARMRAAHAAAASSIFTSRNSDGASGVVVDVPAAGLVRVSVPVYDLHGLHPSEAVTVAEEAVEVARGRAAAGGGGAAASARGWVALLVGAGHHSNRRGKGGRSLADAVRDALGGSGVGAEVFGREEGLLVVRG
jgi:hypothetical protein